MYENLLREKLISEMKNLINKAEEIENNKDLYCEFMKQMILNTYSDN
jgi:hypothetical protein